jgi:uncharacterized protein (TIGR00645 family)
MPEAARPALERLIGRVIFAARWFMAPLYLGLTLLLVLLVVQFYGELGHVAQDPLDWQKNDMMVAALGLVDLVLVASVVVMVMLSGFASFVAKISGAEGLNVTQLDIRSLKVKILASVVVISAIDLLKLFLDIAAVPERKLMWLVIIHLTLLVTAVVLAVVDRIADEH